MLVVQRALMCIIIRLGKVFRFPTDSEWYVQQFVTTFRMVFVTPPKIYCGEKTHEKTGNSKIGLITYTFRAEIIVSQQRNYEQFCYRKISDSIYFQDGPKNICAILRRSLPLKSTRLLLFLENLESREILKMVREVSGKMQKLSEMLGKSQGFFSVLKIYVVEENLS